ncbi:MAG: ribosome maturation factor RimM [Christensenellaceae bacterium]|nr:ribosome maturation factor RimM [Christensenellaceae bacterium]
MSLIIGKIVKAQGIKGEVKILPITDDVLRFNKLKKAIVGENRMTVESARVSGDCAYVKFHGVDTRNDAELLVNQYVSVEREDAVKLPENTWFIADLLGSRVFVEDEEIGTLTDVLQNAKVDVYVVSDGKKEVMFPALKTLIKSVDVENKRIVLSRERFGEVAVEQV